MNKNVLMKVQKEKIEPFAPDEIYAICIYQYQPPSRIIEFAVPLLPLKATLSPTYMIKLNTRNVA